jgi:uncharacterized protein YciU (UPF0263 family)
MRNATRLKDENGTEIFEGDILECQNEGVRDVMTWSEDWQYHLKCNLNHDQEGMAEWVVIGNIQDNPELLDDGN